MSKNSELVVETPLPTYRTCMVCGPGHPSGVCTKFRTGEGGRVHADFKPSVATGYGNIVHGGLISAFLDELMGWPICLQNELICYTGEFTVRFLRPVFMGQRYIGTGYPGVRPEGKRYWEARGELADEQGTIYASGTGRYFTMTEQQTRAFGSQMTFDQGDLPIFREPLPKP